MSCASPHSLEAEQSVLGALLLDDMAFDKAAAVLNAAAFYRYEHQLIWDAITSLVMASKPADVITVFEALQRTGRADDAGGLAYLNDLAQSVASATNVRGYADIVAERARARRVIALADEMAGAVWRGDDALVAIDSAMVALLALSQGRGENDPRPLDDLLPVWVEELQAREAGELDAIPTGLGDVDELLAGGLRRGELMVIGSRPSMGKTALCHMLARNMARTAPVLVLSMEDSLQMLVSRQVAAAGLVNLADLRNPARARGPLWDGVTRGLDALRGLPIHVDDQPALSLETVRRKAQGVAARQGDLGVMIVDYLQLMEGKGNDESRAYELNRIARGLKPPGQRTSVRGGAAEPAEPQGRRRRRPATHRPSGRERRH
ncbi:replicative DNA helicase [Paucibacter sp. O1-1]|nr:replicative DNA helicase [Paucibacter sp. O1-1]MDA3825233.1 replicative DNA helicase [Paucibacter sp. O1-1]